jgi:hypothetical protein
VATESELLRMLRRRNLAAEEVRAEGSLVGTSVIPAPHPDLKRLLL